MEDAAKTEELQAKISAAYARYPGIKQLDLANNTYSNKDLIEEINRLVMLNHLETLSDDAKQELSEVLESTYNFITNTTTCITDAYFEILFNNCSGNSLSMHYKVDNNGVGSYYLKADSNTKKAKKITLTTILTYLYNFTNIEPAMELTEQPAASVPTSITPNQDKVATTPDDKATTTESDDTVELANSTIDNSLTDEVNLTTETNETKITIPENVAANNTDDAKFLNDITTSQKEISVEIDNLLTDNAGDSTYKVPTIYAVAQTKNFKNDAIPEHAIRVKLREVSDIVDNWWIDYKLSNSSGEPDGSFKLEDLPMDYSYTILQPNIEKKCFGLLQKASPKALDIHEAKAIMAIINNQETQKLYQNL